jgi:la-related protein 1
MTSAAARPLGDSGPAHTTFSYAQAAKGRATSSTVSTVQSRAPSTNVSTVQSNKAVSGTSTPPEESNPQTENLSGTAVTGVADADRIGSTNGEPGSKIDSNEPESEKQSTPLMPPKSSPSVTSDGTASTSTLTKEDDTPAPLRLSDSPWDRSSHVEAASEKASEVTDRKKGKKGKKEKAEKESEVEKEEPKPEILVAAPPPAVNIWQQRKEAQAAKAKTSPQIVESPQFSTEDSTMNGAAAMSGSRSMDPKKKAKAGLEDTERSAGAAQNAGAKEQPISSKTQRKSSEANVRSKEESGGKRPAPRGSRVSDKEEKSAAKILPPPVEDAISWPTPDTAVEEKRKPQEKVEKEDKEEGASNKPRPKEKWVTVPYTPTVTFNTPLPARGRGGRGGGSTRGGSGRGGHASNGSISGDRSFPSTTMVSSSTTEARERGRDSMSAGRAASLPPNSSKRPVGDNAYTAQDQRKPSISTFEKPKIESSAPSTKGEHYPSRENRRMSMAAQTESFSSQERQPLNDISKSNKSDVPNMVSSENQSQQRSAGLERRSEPNARMNDFPKDTNGHGQSRERGEARVERGRGGYRGRGAHSNFQNGQPPAQHPFTNGHTPQPQNSYALRQNSIPFSPQPQQQQQQQQQQQYTAAYLAPGRTGRAAPPRSQSIPSNNTVYSRFSPNVPSAAQQIPPLQTIGPVFDYPGMQTMSAVPYDPYMEQYSLLATVTMQLEYYFSIDNLCKDLFLRKQMDSKGFVPLTVIQKFKRIQSLTTDPGLLRFACQESEIIEIVIGEDGVDRLRRQDGWDKWVLPMEERDESARNDGPERYFRHPMQSRPQPVVQRMIVAPHSATSPPPFSPNGIEPSFRPYVPVFNGPNGMDHAMVYQTESPLSAAVPDFAPNLQPKSTTNELDAETTFTDEEVDNLQLVYNSKGPGDTKPRSPFHNASSRTFSNGSIDGRTLTEELFDLHKRQGRTLTNGDSSNSDL